MTGHVGNDCPGACGHTWGRCDGCDESTWTRPTNGGATHHCGSCFCARCEGGPASLADPHCPRHGGCGRTCAGCDAALPEDYLADACLVCIAIDEGRPLPHQDAAGWWR